MELMCCGYLWGWIVYFWESLAVAAYGAMEMGFCSPAWLGMEDMALVAYELLSWIPTVGTRTMGSDKWPNRWGFTLRFKKL